MTRLHHTIGIAVLLASARCGEPRTTRVASLPSDPVIAFVGVTVLPLESATTLPDQTVVVRGERIERIGPSTSIAVPLGARS